MILNDHTQHSTFIFLKTENASQKCIFLKVNSFNFFFKKCTQDHVTCQAKFNYYFVLL